MEDIRNYDPTIKHLIEVSNERREGYLKALKKIKDPLLVNLFERYAFQSEVFGDELAQFFETGPHTRDLDHEHWRIWSDILPALEEEENENALVNACLAGEEATKRNYEEAMEEGIPMVLRRIVNRQYEEINKAIDQIKISKSMNY